MSLNDFSICEYKGVEFFEHVFPLKKNIFTAMHETLPMNDNVSMPASISVVRESVDEPKRIKRCRIEISFGSNFLTTILIEDFGVNFLTDELVFTFFIEEDPQTFAEVM